MWATLLLMVYCGLIVLGSLAGGWLPVLVRLSHARMQVMMSFVGGFMLGIALLHLLPHAVVKTKSVDAAVLAALIGLLTIFFLIRIFGGHSHDVPGEDPHSHGDHSTNAKMESGSGEHGFRWVGLAFGLTLHTLIDGIALAASVDLVSDARPEFHLVGIGAFLAILLHKPLDALSITTVMVAGGSTRRFAQLVNAGFALACPLGALGFYLGVQQAGDSAHVVGVALAFSAGVFLCISLGDILPEVHFHAHDRVKLSLALAIGAALAYAVGFIEPNHTHLPGGNAVPGASQPVDGDDHVH